MAGWSREYFLFEASPRALLIDGLSTRGTVPTPHAIIQRLFQTYNPERVQHSLSMKIPALQHQPTQQGVEVFQSTRNQVADRAIALPDAVHAHQA